MIDVEEVTDEAQQAFWAKVVELIPQATSGDLSPGTQARFNDATLGAVREWIDNNVPRPKMQITEFEFDGIKFKAGFGMGSYFGVDNGRLVSVPMLVDGSPATFGHFGEPEVGEVTNFDDNQEELDKVNALLGTNFKMSQFPGR